MIPFSLRVNFPSSWVNRLKRFTVFPILYFITSSPMPANESLQINITGLRNNQGQVLISLFNSPSGFPGNPSGAYRKIKLPVNNRSAAVTFDNIPAGTYAVAILHDENNDQKMNSNFFGIPKEGYGFSNNVMGALGPPSFSKSSIQFDGFHQLVITITARYGW